MSRDDGSLSYAGHLQLDRLLSCQARESERQGTPAHDEMLFITVHQAYELWFKQVLFELDRIEEIFAGEVTDDRALGFAVHGLERIVEIQKLLLQHLDVLETMTPLDFLEFRGLLFPASGFQSLQFRLIEIRLGLRRPDRLTPGGWSFDQALGEDERARVAAAEARPSLLERLERWLERTPFVEMAGFSFREAYRRAVDDLLSADAELARATPRLEQAGREQEVAALAEARERFEALFDQARHEQLRAEGVWRLSARALQAALFITLYRDEPVLQLPFRLLSLLMDIDETMAAWRYRHALMAQRMIGMKLGTGGSSGHDYLAEAARRYRVFADLFALATFLIPRSALPPLPETLRSAMGYRYTAEEK